MKLSQLKQIIVEEYRKILKESFKSRILANIVKDKFFDKWAKISRWGILLWDQIEDSEIKKITPQEGRKKQSGDSLLFWMKDDKLMAVSGGNRVWDTPGIKNYGYGRRGSRGPAVTTLSLVDMCSHVYEITKEIQDKYPAGPKRGERYNAKSGATALLDLDKIKEDNILRYKKIIANKKSQESNIDAKIKQLMKYYVEKLDVIIDNPVEKYYEQQKKIENVNKWITNLLNLYKEYIYDVKDVQSGSGYLHQTERIQKTIQVVDDAISRITPAANVTETKLIKKLKPTKKLK